MPEWTYYESNIQNFIPKNLLEEVELLENLFIWQQCYLRQPMQAELLIKYLNKDFLDNCVNANLLYSYDDSPQLIYMNPGKVSKFKTFLKENY